MPAVLKEVQAVSEGGKVTTASANNQTVTIFSIDWKGHSVQMTHKGDFSPTCLLTGNHKIEVMHHLEPGGVHMCPTMILWCPKCGAIGNEPEPYECNRWEVSE